MKTRIVAVLTMVLLAAVVQAEDQPPRTVAVSAEGQVEVDPEFVEVALLVQVSSGDLAEAATHAQAVLEEVVKALKEAGLRDEDIGVSPLNVGTESFSSSGTPVLRWRAMRYVTGIVSDLTKLEPMLKSAIGVAGKSIEWVNLRFRHSREEEYRRQAVESACADARAKAKLVAVQFGASLGEVRSIQLDDVDWGTSHEFPSFPGGFPGQPDFLTYDRGRIRIGAQVKVTFDLVP